MNKKNIKKIISRGLLFTFLLGLGVTNKGSFVRANEADAAVQSTVSEKRNVMYYGDWSIWGGQKNFYPQGIPADQLTHLNFAFLDFDAQGNLKFTDKDAALGAPLNQEGVQWNFPNSGVLNALQDLRAKNPNLKIGVSLGGWSKSGDFSEVTANDATRAKFIENIMKFIQYLNLDFVDYDWEYPGFERQPDLVDNVNDEGTVSSRPEDKENYIKLLADTRAALDSLGKETGKEYELSVALPATRSKFEVGVDVEKMFEIIDFGNIMSYDLRGAFDGTSGHQTPLYGNPNDPQYADGFNINDAVSYLLENGAPSEKIVVGAAFYTRGWEKVSQGPDASLPGLYGEAEVVSKDADGTPSRGAANEDPLTIGSGGRRGGVWSYRGIDDLKKQYPGLKEYWDDTAKAPYLYDETTGAFFTYDNPRSIEEKTNYVNDKNLGGVISWMASQDKPTDDQMVRDELTKSVKQGLFGDAELPDHSIRYENLDVAVDITPYKESWGNVGGYEVTIRNNEVKEEQDEVLGMVETSAETLKLPKIYIKSEGENLTSGDYRAGSVTNQEGYTVIDLSSNWDGQMINQGSSYTFRLQSDSPSEDITRIKEVHIAQRISKTGAEIGQQTLLLGEDVEIPNPNPNPNPDGGEGDGGDGEVAPPQPVNTPPVIQGVENKTIKVGQEFDKMAGVEANDKESGNLTSSIVVEGEVDVNTVGEYSLVYKVTDPEGLESVARRQIVVKEDVVVKESKFNVGYGVEWPAQVNAPFVDMTGWVTKEGYANNGAPNLVKLAQDTGLNFFNLGFIQSVGNQIVDGKVKWGWGGYEVLAENHNNDQYEGIKKSIRELREMGGDATISLGGLNGVALWEVTQDPEILYNTYKEIVEGYGLTRLDLDIEGGAQNKEHNIQNAKAIKRLQDETGVKIVLTLPVLPSGLTHLQLGVVEAYLSQGVDVEMVNIMTMCYGPATLLPGENYGTASLRAVDSLKDQLKDYYSKFAGVELTDEQAYAKIGTTPSVGFEGEAHPIFTADWMKLVTDHAIEKGIGMVSFWSINRDAQLEANKGVNSQYEFTKISKAFGQNGPVGPTNPGDGNDGDGEDNNGGGEVVPPVNQAPQIIGAVNKQIYVGSEFNPMEGITATDLEDKDLTSSISVEGQVDVNTPGEYVLIYRVSDSQGLTTERTIVITVKENLSLDGDTYDASKVYLTGDQVVYGGVKYTAKWWTQGEDPATSEAWEREVILNEDGSVDHIDGTVYNGGEVVNYNGKKFKAKWWTNTTPGSDESWEEISTGGESGGVSEYNSGKNYVQGDRVSYEGKIYEAKWWTNTTPGSDESWMIVE